MPWDRTYDRILSGMRDLKEDVSAAQLAKLKGLNPRTVANKLLQLEAKGMVTRVPERSSQFACLWRLTR